MNYRFISQDEYVNYYLRHAIPYEGFVTGLGYAYCQYNMFSPTVYNPNGQMFWDRFPPTLLIQAIDSSDYMKERSLNISSEEISKLVLRTNLMGDTVVNLGNGKEVTIPKNATHKVNVCVNDTGSQVNISVSVTVDNENGMISASTECRLKDFPFVFMPSNTYLPVCMNDREINNKQASFDWFDATNFALGAASIYNIFPSQYLKYNEIWHVKKSGEVSTIFNRKKWNNPGAKYWRGKQVEPFTRARSIGKVLRKLGFAALGADIFLSGELKPSHAINGGMIGISWTGWGTIVAGIWFIADYGTMGYNWLFNDEAKGIGDIIDNLVEEEFGRLEFYEGLY